MATKKVIKIKKDGSFAVCHYTSGGNYIPTQDYQYCSVKGYCNTLETKHVPKIVVYNERKIKRRYSCALRRRQSDNYISGRYLEISQDRRVSLCLSANFIEKDSLVLEIYGKKDDKVR